MGLIKFKLGRNGKIRYPSNDKFRPEDDQAETPLLRWSFPRSFNNAR